MAERVTAFAVRIGEAVALRLQTHAQENAEQWFAIPTGVEYGLRLAWQEMSRPFVGVSVTGLDDDQAGSSSEQGRGHFHVTVWAWVNDSADPERAAHEIASDIRRALTDTAEGKQLGGVLSSGYMWPTGYEVVIAPDIGEGLAVLAFDAMCQMDETNS